MLIATSLLLAACAQKDPTDPFIQNAPEEEVRARNFVKLVLAGDYTGLYRLLANDGIKDSEEDFVAFTKWALGEEHERVTKCGGLEAIEVLKRDEIKPGEHYRLIYRVYTKDWQKDECKPWNFMELHAIKSTKGWVVKM